MSTGTCWSGYCGLMMMWVTGFATRLTSPYLWRVPPGLAAALDSHIAGPHAHPEDRVPWQAIPRSRVCPDRCAKTTAQVSGRNLS